MPIPRDAFCRVVRARRAAGKTVPGSLFGPRTLNGVRGFHAGQDVPCPTGTPLLAVDDGIVTAVELGTSAGNIVRYETETGRVSCMHLDTIDVSVGDLVNAGERIGTTGHTGNVSPPGPGGAHLHIEWRPFTSTAAVDPLPMFPIQPEDCPT